MVVNLILPPGCKVFQEAVDGCSYVCGNGLFVIVSEAKELDGKTWLHVSFSRKSKLPSYEDIKWVKQWFIGDDKTAYQVFPKAKDHVNIAKTCLHLWHCKDSDPLPDFTRGLGMI